MMRVIQVTKIFAFSILIYGLFNTGYAFADLCHQDDAMYLAHSGYNTWDLEEGETCLDPEDQKKALESCNAEMTEEWALYSAHKQLFIQHCESLGCPFVKFEEKVQACTYNVTTTKTEDLKKRYDKRELDALPDDFFGPYHGFCTSSAIGDIHAKAFCYDDFNDLYSEDEE